MHAARFATVPRISGPTLEAKLEQFARTGAGDVKRLKGRAGARLRVRDWRVIFIETTTTVEVRAAGHRREIYK